MAGSLSESEVAEKVPRCPNHDTPCVVKTGTKHNASHGKSFFICGKCSYAETSDFDATVCPHHLKMVELKAFASKPDGLRCYFRCIHGKETGSMWCGHQVLRSNRLVKILQDITNCQTINKSTIKSSNNTSQISALCKSIHKDHNLLNANSTDKNETVTIFCDSSYDTVVHVDTDSQQPVHHRNTGEVQADVGFERCERSKTDHSEVIEIVSSSDEGENNEEAEENQTENNSEALFRSSAVGKSLQQTTDTVESIEMLITKQKELHQKISSNTSDGGKKLEAHIEHLQNKLKEMKCQQKVSLSSQPAPASVKLPAMLNPLIKQVPTFNIAFDKNAPLFGGRMTESRLKEVGRVTKGAIEQLHKSLDTCPISTDEAEDPKGLTVALMTHQKQAMAWLMWREKQIPSGGILADDMGLGKTLTMISLSLKSKQDGLTQIKGLPADSNLFFSKSTVLVCPASLVHQWHKEIEKRVEKDQLKVCLYHGPNRERRIKELAGCDIVLTTYNIVSIEGKPYVMEEKDKPKAGLSNCLDATAAKKCEEGPLFKIFWRRIILDEGHNIKNPKTATSIATCHLEGESRWIVTGTPIQNKALDLFSLIKFLRVSPFDELKVWKREVDNKSPAGTKRMNSIVKSLLLRRTKDQTDQKTGKALVSLPKRSAILHTLQLSEEETAVYDVIHKFSKNMFTQFLDTRKTNPNGTSSRPDKQPPKSDSTEMPSHVLGMNIDEALTMFGLRGVNATNSGCLLVLLLRLRQCCAHLSLMCQPLDEELCKSEGIDVPLEEQFGNLSIDERSPNFKTPRPIELKSSYQSTKISTLLSQLMNLREKSRDSKPIKSVIVSQWTRMLDTIAYHLKREGFKYDFITGSVNAKKRSDIVENFNDQRDPQVMLVSLKAGGVGLNLIGGSHLFLLDQHWNPALEDQACDRIYRVGQKNDVVIHRFLCENTVEERIVQLQEKKKILANNVLYGGKAQKLTLDDLKMLFGLSK